jgi:hypothetical protein
MSGILLHGFRMKNAISSSNRALLLRINFTQLVCNLSYLSLEKLIKTIEHIIREIQRDLTPQFEQKLRQVLLEQDKEWLVEQVIRLTLDAHSLREMDRKTMLRLKAQQREERLMRVRLMALDKADLRSFTQSYASYDRSKLIDEGFLLSNAPEKGTDLISAEFRTSRGQELLLEARTRSSPCFSEMRAPIPFSSEKNRNY